MRRLLLALPLSLLPLACAAPEEPASKPEPTSTTAPAEPEPTDTALPAEPGPEATPEAAPEAGKDLTVSGTLKYTELPKTKSVEAYMGREFTLTDGEGAEHNLKASEAVSHEALVALDGKSITVTCTPYPAEAPDAMESAPTDMDGKAMERPAGCRVQSIDAGAD